MRCGVALVAVAVCGLAEAAPSISLGPFRGDRGQAVSRQLAGALCDTYQCVPRSQVSTAGRPDLRKARRLGVAAILAGTVSRKRGERLLSLALLTRSARPARAWTFRLTRAGTLDAASLQQLARDLEGQLGVVLLAPPAPRAEPPRPAAPPLALPEPPSAAPPPAEPPPAEPALALPPPAPPPLAPRPAEETPAALAPPPPEAPAPARRAPPAAPAAERARPLLAVEAGASITQRKLTYRGTPAGSALLGYSIDTIISPRLRLEVFPAARLTAGALGGIGLFGGYGTSVGLKTEGTGTAPGKHATTFTRLEGGVMWRIHPLSSSDLAVVPAASYQQLKFTVDPLNGVAVAGLPNANLTGVKAGLDLEIPLGGAFTVLAGGGYVKWLTAKDLVKGSVAFFPGGSAYAIEAEAGLSVAISGSFSVRILGDYSSTSYTLDPDPTGTYQATGAKDQYLGGRALVRWQL